MTVGPWVSRSELPQLLEEARSIYQAIQREKETMPPTTQKSSLFAKFGERYKKATAKAAAAPIDWGNERLPGGITNGIARLVSAEFGKVAPGKANAGMDFIRFAGVVLEPEFVEDKGVRVPVAGRQTSIIEMLADTKTTNGQTSFEEHVFNASNHMKRIANDENFDTTDLEEAARTLVTCCEDPVTGQPCGPVFRFTTRESPDTLNPDGSVKYAARVWEEWWGGKGLENYMPPEAAGVTDQTPPLATAPTSNGAKAPPAKKPPQHSSRVAQAAPEPEDNVEEPAAEGGMQLMELGEAADGGDTDALEQLKELAAGTGFTTEQIEAAQTWSELAQWIEAGTPPESGEEDAAEGEGEEPAAEEEETPAETAPLKEDIYLYRPLMKDGKTRAKKPVEVEVLSVNEEARTVTVRDMDTKKTIMGPINPKTKKAAPLAIGWDDLEENK